jgi:hypothetical protein
LREIIKKQEAIKQGLKFYYTGKPCKYGHICSRMVLGCKCLDCRPISPKFDTRTGMYDNHIAIYYKDREYDNRRVNFDFNNLSPENCYILGLLWADGGHYTQGNAIRISIQNVAEDMQELENIFYKTGNWSKVFAKKGKGSDGVIRRNQIKFQTSDRMFGQTLLNFGFKDKSLIAPQRLLDIIPKHLLHLWYRGYWDGDGCFYNGKGHRDANIAGNYNYDFSFMMTQLRELNINFKYKQESTIMKNGRNSSYSRITFNGYDSIMKFGNFIYKEYADILLPRKYEKYKLCIEKKPIRSRNNIQLIEFKGVNYSLNN